MHLPTRPVWAEIDTKALGFNVAQFRRRLAGGAGLMAVVKADGYGHGALPAARTALAHGAGSLGVAFPEEGAELRRAGVAAPIVVLGGLVPEQLELCAAKELAVSVFQWDAAVALSGRARRLNKTVRVHVKVDTGMGRLGLHPNEAAAFVRRAGGLPHLDVQGVFTHFASADEQGEYYQWQLQRVRHVLRDLENEGLRVRVRHCANTAATLFDESSHLDLVRVGLGLYGLYPNEQRPLELQPAFSLRAKLAAVRLVPPGTAVSYGSTFVTWKQTHIGVVPIGYADGADRRLGGRGAVLIQGRRCPIVGKVCMDHIMVDLGDMDVSPGTEVVLIGSQDSGRITVDDWADWLGTINYEIPCMISKRVERVYV